MAGQKEANYEEEHEKFMEEIQMISVAIRTAGVETERTEFLLNYLQSNVDDVVVCFLEGESDEKEEVDG